ncbi:MAG: NADH-quinone oxidoreductase subunit L [Acidobacteriota bacterium]
MQPISLLWLIPVLPALGALINGVVGWKWEHTGRKWITLTALLSTGLSLALALWNIVWLYSLDFAKLPSLPSNVTVDPAHHSLSLLLGQWLPVGSFTTGTGQTGHFMVNWLFVLDPLAAIMLFVVTFVGFMIHVYSVGYMAHDHGYFRFFAYLNLFMAMMLTLVLGGNYLVMFIGWEGVGLCSYLLIGFYYEKDFCADAGKKAFLTNRIGDMGFAAALMLMLYWFGTLNMSQVNHLAVSGTIPGWVLTAVGLLLFAGATGKSAQIPLYVWLPDAMAGPTPVSALIHAATMVTSGVYLIARSNGIYSMSPTALMVVAGVGCATAFFAATIGLVQNDIKKVLAYSTVSQLGYMFLGVGVGAYAAGVFHLYTHAFFKGLLFLGAGSVIHAMGGVQDIRKMGRLFKKIPHTAWTFILASLAISGIPLFSGFFSKDEVLWQALNGNSGPGHFPKDYAVVLWAVGVAAALLTAFYMFRLVYLTFFNSDRVDEETRHHIHESPKVMTIPLWVLGIGSVIVGYVGLPKAWLGGHENFWERWFGPVLYHPHTALAEHAVEHSAGAEWAAMGLSVVVALIGLGLAALWYRRETAAPSRLALALPRFYRLVLNKYFVDELYFAAFIRPFVKLSEFAAAVDRWIVDGAVNVAGYSNEVLGMVLRFFQTGYVRNYALLMLAAVVVLLIFFI